MSEREPITAELRELMGGVEPRVDEDGVVTAKYVTPEAWGEFVRRCDAIDAVHAGLERENAELRERLAVLDKRDDSMHIGGSITDELRRVAAKTECANGRCEKLYRGDLDHIADRIDAEHERMLGDWDYWESTHIELPKDADGEYIHVGDEVEEVDYDGHASVFEVRMTADGWWVCAGGICRRPDRYRHYHVPTVEDVLREMADRCYADEDEPRDRDAIVAEYAAKLRLAEEKDA